MRCPNCGGLLFPLPDEIMKDVNRHQKCKLAFGCPICEELFGFTVMQTFNNYPVDNFFKSKIEEAKAMLLFQSAVSLAKTGFEDVEKELAMSFIVQDEEDELPIKMFKQRTLDILTYAGGLL